MAKVRAHFNVVRVDEKNKFLMIIDNDDGAMSITNDAENVVEHLLNEYGSDYRIIYRDTMMKWDEIEHDGKQFVGFKPLPKCFQPEGLA